MQLLDKLERKLGAFAVPNLTLFLVFGQAAVFIMALTRAIDPGLFQLVPAEVLRGQVWRLFTFPLVPAIGHPLFFAFALYLFYLMGSALEAHWGDFRYNVYLLIGYAATVAAAFVTPNAPAGNAMLGSSVFLAFAYLNPDFTLYLFFVLPVRIKWLALLTWALLGLGLIGGDWPARLRIVAAVGNYLLFFGPEIAWRLKNGSRRARWEGRVARSQPSAGEPIHRCVVCGRTDQSHPELGFRYCGRCAGNPCYCEEHLADHAHELDGSTKSAQND